MNTESRWLRMGEACRYARVCRKTMRRLVNEGHISSGYTPGGHHRIDRESIDAYFREPDQKALAIYESFRL